jgi:hypothetical protein
MAKVILAHDFYVAGVGHFLRSSGPSDFRVIPDHVVLPTSAQVYRGGAEAPLAVAPALPWGAGKAQTVEDVIAAKTAAPVADPRDDLIKSLTARLDALEAEKEKPSVNKAPTPDLDPELAKALAASRDTKAAGDKPKEKK